MKPYYEDDSVTIYHGDCREVLPAFATASVEAVFADPPYNVGLEYATADSDKMVPEMYRDWCRSWFQECRRIATGSVVVTPGMVSVPMWLADIERTHFIVAWTKSNNNSRNYIGPTSGYQCWEPMLVYGKSVATVLRDWWDVPISQQADTGNHPCPKPIRLLRRVVESFTTSGGVVLDPFVGSGTTLLAAKAYGRKAIGIEIEERYCEIAAKRLAQEVLAL